MACTSCTFENPWIYMGVHSPYSPNHIYRRIHKIGPLEHPGANPAFYLKCYASTYTSASTAIYHRLQKRVTTHKIKQSRRTDLPKKSCKGFVKRHVHHFCLSGDHSEPGVKKLNLGILLTYRQKRCLPYFRSSWQIPK